eukprot:CAMPEP_0197583206 /NCGR_PEP_ID=MMETSP1326-20131121/6195_1 /TAXON_ID=1155430 /ORGANISM="Genus nov. species nov., Strain RCC2288" /LENGTH=102 /DNA_ID=CAMNT_0043147393 /DNA_START=104 /DNA_END=407 /DNA_ORIENTATION=+
MPALGDLAALLRGGARRRRDAALGPMEEQLRRAGMLDPEDDFENFLMAGMMPGGDAGAAGRQAPWQGLHRNNPEAAGAGGPEVGALRRERAAKREAAAAAAA